VPFASLASQKNHMTLDLFCMYADPAFETWFREAWTATGKKLDMGKSCVRFKRLEDLPLDVVGKAICKVPVRTFLAYYESQIKSPSGAGKRPAARKQADVKKRAVAKKRSARKKLIAKK
jgi:hypothetical protein